MSYKKCKNINFLIHDERQVSLSRYNLKSHDGIGLKILDNLPSSVNQVYDSVNKQTDKSILPFFYFHEESSEDINKTIEEWKESFYFIVDSLIDKIKQNLLKVVVVDILESSYYLDKILTDISSRYDFKIYCLTINFKLKSKNNLIYLHTNYWQRKMPGLSKPIEYMPIKDYINLNRAVRIHRIRLIEELYKNNLFDKGFNTWNNQKLKDFDTEHILNKVDFQTLDIEDKEKVNPNNFVPLEHCKQSFLFLATETHIGSDDLLLSEKTFKPIALGMPFLILGNDGILEYLRNQGFVTLSEWLDESYDLDYSLDKKLEIIIKNLKYISSLNNKDKKRIRKEMKEVCSYNLNLYKLKFKKNQARENLLLILNEDI